jgi:hypothetical protein
MGHILVRRFKTNNNRHVKSDIQMNKKADSLPMEQLIGIIILVILFFIIFGAFFRPKEGWLNYVADKAEGFTRFIPGRDEIPHPSSLEIPESLSAAYDNIYVKFRDLSQSSDQECYVKLDKTIPELNKIRIIMTGSKDGLDMEIQNQQQTISPETIPNLKPCIIAGKASDGSNVANNFEKYFGLRSVTKDPTKKDVVYNDVSSIEIKEEGWGKSADITAEGTAYNLDYSNLLYKHDSQHICFIPNVGYPGACDGYRAGLDNDCFPVIISGRLIHECKG